MRYDELETSIVERLQTVATALNITIVELPEKQSEYGKPVDRARVTVAYNGSVFNGGRYGSQVPTMSTDTSSQEEDIEFVLTIQSKKRRGDGDGIYNVMEQIRKRMLGFEPMGLDKLKLMDQKFEEYAEGIWTYTQKFATKRISTYDIPDADDPTLDSVSFVENF